MNAKRIFQSLLLCTLLATSLARAQEPPTAQPQTVGGFGDVLERQRKALVGTWATKLTPPPESGVPAFPGFFTFTSDGNLIATQSGGPVPALGNPQIGLWAHNGGRQFTITYFVQDFDEHSFQQVASEEARATITLNDAGDRFTGIIGGDIFDLDGHLIVHLCCATFEGQRLAVKPLQLSGNNPEPEAQPASPTQNDALTPGQREWGWARKRAKTQP